jgi:hypothetical protein
MAALNEVCDAFENICDLPHDPQPFLHEREQFPVFLGCCAFLNKQVVNNITTINVLNGFVNRKEQHQYFYWIVHMDAPIYE